MGRSRPGGSGCGMPSSNVWRRVRMDMVPWGFATTLRASWPEVAH